MAGGMNWFTHNGGFEPIPGRLGAVEWHLKSILVAGYPSARVIGSIEDGQPRVIVEG
jgi:hypothetical protein